MSNINLYTIGFTKKSASTFFKKLSDAGVSKIIDTRLNNVSQLAGFAKRDDLKFFLKEICNIDYVHLSDLAPTQEMLDQYKKETHDWKVYEERFVKLISEREIEKKLSFDFLKNACLLCSEDKPHHCHRRLVAEYLKKKNESIEIKHIL
jgi:uncharacterized protein (DUF488 family)